MSDAAILESLGLSEAVSEALLADADQLVAAYDGENTTVEQFLELQCQKHVRVLGVVHAGANNATAEGGSHSRFAVLVRFCLRCCCVATGPCTAELLR